MTWLFSPPSLDDLIRLLKAWRFWSIGALIGATIGAAFYYITPPPYQARATALVDFNLEQAWPQETDRQHFFYLEREARKLKEIAWSDPVLQVVADRVGTITINELREEKLELSQPAEGGWHFYATDHYPERAAQLASAWAQAFADQATQKVKSSEGLNSFIEIDVTQSENLPVKRSVSLSEYLLVGALGFLLLSSFYVLFIHFSSNRAERSVGRDETGDEG